VEPQWNPTIEAQAIGRALRLGQTQQVTVMRYIMENTVEQVVFSGRTIYHCQALTPVSKNILAIQKRKEKLAQFALKAGLEQSPSERFEVSGIHELIYYQVVFLLTQYRS
jgi:hypothetical protein